MRQVELKVRHKVTGEGTCEAIQYDAGEVVTLTEELAEELNMALALRARRLWVNRNLPRK